MPRGVKATAGDSAKPSQDLEALPRKELQALAKDLGVKANGKSADIIAGVRAAQSTVAAHEPPPPAADDAAQAEQHVEEEEAEVQVTRKVTRGKTKVPTAAKATTGRVVRGKARPDAAASSCRDEPAGDEQPQHAHNKSKTVKPSQRVATTTTTTTSAAAATHTSTTTSTKSREAAAAAGVASDGTSTAKAVRGGAGRKAAAAKVTDVDTIKAMDGEAKGSVVVDAVDEARAPGGKGRKGLGRKARQQEQRVEGDEQPTKAEEAAAESVKPKAKRSTIVATNTAASSSSSTNNNNISRSSNRRGRSTAVAAVKTGARGAKGPAKKSDAEEEAEAVEHTVIEPAAQQQQQDNQAAVEVATTKGRRTKKAPVSAPVEEKAEVADESEGPEPVVETQTQHEPPTAIAPAAKGRKGRGGAATAKTTRAQTPPLPPPPRNDAHEQDLSEQAEGRDGEEQKQGEEEEEEEIGEAGPTTEELRGMSCVALRALAKRLGVKASSSRKADLINALRISCACDTASDPPPAAAAGVAGAAASAAAEGGEAGCSTATESGGSVGGAAREGDEDQRVKQQPRRASLRLASQTDAAVRDQQDSDVAHTTPGGVDLAKQRRQELLREKKEARDLERKQRVLKKSEKNMRDIGLSKTPYHDTQKRKLLGRKDDPHKPWFRGFRVKHDHARRGVKGGDGDKKPSVPAVPRRIKAARRAQRIEKETQEACERLEKSFAKRYFRAEHREKIKDTGVRKAQQNRRDKFVSKSRSRRSIEYARNREAAMLTISADPHAQAHTSDNTHAKEEEAVECVKVGGRSSGGARRRSSVGSSKPLGPVKQGRGSLAGGGSAVAGASGAVHSDRGSDLGAAAGAEKPRSGGVRVRRRSSTTTTTTTNTTNSTKKPSGSSDHSGVKVMKKSPVGAIVKRRGSSIGAKSGRRSVEAGGARRGFVVDDMPSPPVC